MSTTPSVPSPRYTRDELRKAAEVVSHTANLQPDIQENCLTVVAALIDQVDEQTQALLAQQRSAEEMPLAKRWMEVMAAIEILTKDIQPYQGGSLEQFETSVLPRLKEFLVSHKDLIGPNEDKACRLLCFLRGGDKKEGEWEAGIHRQEGKIVYLIVVRKDEKHCEEIRF